MKTLYLQFLMVCFCMISVSNLNATLSDGDEAADFSSSDIDGVGHSLYGYLDTGKSVVIDMSATWCGPCWSFHQSGTMDDIYSDYGPGGDDLMMAMMIEVDPGTNQECFFGPTGCNNTTLGDWSAGIDIPLLNPGSTDAANINSDFDVSVYPTIYVISPTGWVKALVGSGTSYDQIESWGAYSFQMHNSTWDIDGDGCGLGSIDLHPFMGFGNISYQWSNGATTEDLSDIEAGEYYVTMTDGNGYEAEIGPIEVQSSPEMVTETVSLVDIHCAGNSSGYIEIETTGGTEDFDYEWDNGESGAVLSGLFGGSYSVTITDNNTGCETFASYSIYEPDDIEIEYDITPGGCNGELGEIEFNLDGGTYPFVYVINGNTYYNDDIELPGGNYFVDITDDNLCTSSASFTISQPTAPTAMSSVLGEFNCTSNPVYVTGAGSSSGGNIEYAWYDAAGVFLGSSVQLQVTAAGNYSLNVNNITTDCSSSSVTTVTTNTTTPVAMSSVSNNLTCSAPTAVVSGAGSTNDGSSTFNWSTSDGNIVGSPTSIDVTVDAPGTYTLTVTNSASGCASVTSQTITEALPPSITAPGNTAFCAGGSSNVCITLAANETIQWVANGIVVGTSSCITANAVTTYTATVTNSTTGCSSAQIVQTTVNALPTANITGTTSFCNGGSTILCHTQEAGITYNWVVNGTAVNYSNCISVNQAGMVRLTSNNGATGCNNLQEMTVVQNALPQASIATPNTIDCTNSTALLDLTIDNPISTVSWFNEAGLLISTDQDISVGQAGNYTAMVTNPAGCQAQTTVTVTTNTSLPQISIDQPSMINCTNPSSLINLNVNNPGYTISWYDAAGALISNDEDITVSSAGTYTATAVNSAGCETQTSVIIEADNSVPQVSIAPPANEIDCNNSSVTLSATIVNGNTQTWYDANGNNLGTGTSITVTDGGSYTIHVSNAAGCETTSIVMVSQVNNAVAQAGFSSAASELEIKFTDMTQGMGTISYAWSFGDGNTSTDINPNHTYATSGYYTVCLVTTNECGSTTQCDEVLAITAMTTSADVINASCNGSTDGFITITVAGGLAGYTYTWSDASLMGSSVSGLAAGTYSVTVKDEVDNESVQDVTITEPMPISVIADITSTSMVTSQGAITLDITGGTPGYQVLWSDGSTDINRTGLPQGDYGVLITDVNGCETAEVYTVSGSTNVNELETLINFSVSPNPATNFITVKGNFATTIDVQISVLNMVGQRTVLSSLNTQTLNERFDISNFAMGVYLVELRSNDKIAIKKIVISE